MKDRRTGNVPDIAKGSRRVRALGVGLILAAAAALTGCASEPSTGAFIVDVKSGAKHRIAGAGEVAWAPSSPGPAVWTASKLQLFTADGDERRSIELNDAAEGTLEFSRDHYTYVSLGGQQVVSLDAGRVMLGGLQGGDDAELLKLGRAPHFAWDGRSVIATQVFGDPNTPDAPNAREQLVRLSLRSPAGVVNLKAPQGVVLAALPEQRLLLRTGPGRRNRIVLRDEAGRIKTIVPDDRWRLIRPSVDGSRLMYLGASGAGLLVGPVANEEPARIASGNFPSASWSPDGERIAATTFDGRVLVMRRDGSRKRVVTTFGDARLADVAWSGDGRHLIIDAEEPPPPST